MVIQSDSGKFRYILRSVKRNYYFVRRNATIVYHYSKINNVHSRLSENSLTTNMMHTLICSPSQIYVCKKEPPTKRFFFIASVSRLSAYDCFMPVSVLQEMPLPDCGSEEQCLLRQLLCISLHMHLRKSGPS